MSKVSEAVKIVKDVIENVSDPKKLTTAQYVEFLEEVKDDVDTRLDAARADLRAKERRDG